MSDVLRRFAATIPRPAPVDGGEARATWMRYGLDDQTGDMGEVGLRQAISGFFVEYLRVLHPKAMPDVLARLLAAMIRESDNGVLTVEKTFQTATGGLDLGEAKKAFEEILQTKEWRGEATAGSLYWLGVMEERQGRNAEAVAYYRRCYQTWKKYEAWSAKAYLGTARVLADKLGQKPEAKLVLAEMLSKDRIKDTPEAAEAKTLNTRL
jgi:tetratricopeptide (TPR) repeat protein